MTFTELLNGLPVAILKAIVASLLGGANYFFWRWIYRQVLALTEILGGIVTFLVIMGLLYVASDEISIALWLMLILLVPYALGSCFHLLAVRGTKEQENFAYFSSAFLIAIATFSSLFFGVFTIMALPNSNLGWPDWIYGICLFISPSISPLLIWCWRNMKPRAGYDTPSEE